jgi:hypothetical protein
MANLDVLLAELRGCPPDVTVDRAAVAIAETSEVISALADHIDYDTVAFWSAAGALAEAYVTLLPHTGIELPDPPTCSAPEASNPERLIEVLTAAADALDRTARVTDEPDLLYALARAADLTNQACRTCATVIAVA